MQSIDSILTEIFHLPGFRPQQREIVTDILAGRDTLVVMPTGAGKSLCYQLPATALRGLSVIISPLISLMADQVRQLRALRIPAVMLSSAQSWEQQREVMNRLRDGFRGLLYVAPERFSAPGFLSIITARKLSLLAVDEAHCISQWGHDFRPEYLRLGEIRRQLGNPLTVALTATATPDVRADIMASLELNKPAIHVTGFDRPNLSYQCVTFSKAKDKQPELLDYVRRIKAGGIVYCSTRKQVEEVTTLLHKHLRGRTVVAYHAGMDGDARETNQQRFVDHDDAIAVATNAFGMGINKPNLRFVVHFNLPGSLEAYYQEAGRAGRDGQPAECVLYYATADVMTQKFFVEKIGEGNEQLTGRQISQLQRRATQQLEAVQRYARWERCRRRQILEYFGENRIPLDCHCDVCRERPARAIAVPAERVARGKRRRRDEDDEPVSAPAATSRASSERSDEDVCLARLKDLRREAARALGATFFQHLPDSLLQHLVRNPPRRLEELRDDFELHHRVLERFGPQMLKLLQPLASATPARPAAKPAPNLFTQVEEPRPARATKQRKTAKTAAPEKQSAAKAEALDAEQVTRLHGPAVARRFEALRALRTLIARRKKWRPYQVLHDATLLELARQRPRSERELMQVKGLGEKKVEDFGRELLSELAKG